MTNKAVGGKRGMNGERKIRLAVAIALSVFLFPMSVAVGGGDGTAAPQRGEWKMLGRTPEQHHFSPLTMINDSNVKSLGLAWHADIPTADGLLANPLVADGLVYQIGAYSHVWAIDVRTGGIVWSYDPKVKVASAFASMWSHHLNRGVALWQDRVVFGTSDCRLVALERKTGAMLWDVQACDA